MAYVNRNGVVVTQHQIRQKLENFNHSLDFHGGGIVKISDRGNPFVGAYYVLVRAKWFGNNGQYQHLVAKRNSYGSSTMNFDLFINPSNDHLMLDTGNGTVDFGSRAVLVPGQWDVMCYVKDASPVLKERMYLDIQRVASMSPTGQGTGSSALLSIGACEAGAVEPFNGLIAEVVIGTYSPTWKDVIEMEKKHRYKNVWGHWRAKTEDAVIRDMSKFKRHGVLYNALFSNDVPMKAR